MVWQKGQSGNPKGPRPIVRDFRQRCQNFMAKSGWATLEQLANDPESPHQFRALELVAAYAHGRPTQIVAGDRDAPAALHVTVLFDRPDDDQDQLALP